MKRLLIAIYFTAIFLILFGFTSLIFYKDIQLSILYKLFLISILVYIIIKSNNYKFKIRKDVAILSVAYYIVVGIIR